jgi:hypothetical protein
MSDSILCLGCGQLIRVKPDEAGRKIRCPDCGVLSELPRIRKPPSVVETPGERQALEPVPAGRKQIPSHEEAVPAPASDPRGAKVEKSAHPGKKLRACQHCGELVKMKVDAEKRRRCPACGWVESPPATGRQTDLCQPAEANRDLGQPALPNVAPTRETYGVTRSIEIRCPGCRKELPPEADICPHCDFDLIRGEKPERVYERVERTWEAGMSFRRRLLIFLTGQAVVFATGLPGAILTGHIGAFFFSWIPFTLLFSFVIGTYDRVDLVRKKNGLTLLSKTWRLCLVPFPKTTYRLSEFEGVTVGQANDTDINDWILFMFLVPMGIIPAIIFWYNVIRPEACFVALARDHGYAAETLYRGRKEEQAKEIADALHELAGLPLTH